MTSSRTVPNPSRPRRARLVLLICASVMHGACDVVEVEDAEQSTLCYNYFRDCVNPIFHNSIKLQNTCANSSCHGGASGGNFQVDPLGNISSFNSAVSMMAAGGKLLTYPLDPAHPGGIYVEFADETNACYLEIKRWSQLPVFEPPLEQRPDDPCTENPVCIVSDVSAEC